MNEIDPNLYFNPWDPAFRANPYPFYTALLDGPPRILTVFLPFAVVARYDDVVAVLHDPETFSSTRLVIPGTERIDPFGGARTMLFADPPEHTRLRRLVSRAFTPRRVGELEGRIRKITNRLLDEVERKGEFEVMRDLANPLPVMVISEMLGVGANDYEKFKFWSDEVVKGGATIPGTQPPPSVFEASDALRAYFTEEIEKRRRAPGPDLVSALIAAQEENDALTDGELLAFVLLLLLAGNETTTNLIGNGMLALGRHPEQLAMLRKDPGLMATAVDEILRYDGPVQATARLIKRPVEIGGTQLPANLGMFVVLAAANRDPRQFPEPEKFDITRKPNNHVAFGEGIHYCIGAALAKLEGSIAIGGVLARFARLRLADPAEPLIYKGSFALRGLETLRMSIG